MPSIYDIYERKNYRNRISLARSVSFEVEVRETNLHIQAHSDLNAKAKDSVFRYRYQIEEYLRQHPAFRETPAPIQIYASAPEIVRYTDLSSRKTGNCPNVLHEWGNRRLCGPGPDRGFRQSCCCQRRRCVCQEFGSFGCLSVR